METLAAILREAGLPIYINLCVSVFVVATIIERIIALFFMYRIDADQFVQTIIKAVRAKEIDKAMKICAASKAPVARLCKSGLSQANAGALEISTAIDEELMRVTPLLEKRIASLWSLANIATLIGLLGTIYGLIRAFSALAQISPEQKAAFLARGISEAMNNTAVGLAIAILCMVGHLILSGTSKKMLADLDVSAVTFENFLILRERGK
jgi:biopolymer transport protein ExbB/TolQ